MRSVLVSFIFLVVLFIVLPQIGMAVLKKSYKEHSAYLFSDGINENAAIVEPITQCNQNSDSDEIVVNADATALIKFTYFMHELSEIKNQTIECTLSKIFFELNEDSAFQETPNNIENDEVVYFVAVKPSENNDLNQFLIRGMPLKDFSAYLENSSMLLWVCNEGTRVYNQGMRESLGMYSPSIQLLTKQHSLLLQSHGDENFLLYFPCSVKDTSANHYTRTYYAFFLFRKYESDVLSFPCILRALAGSNDIDEDRVAENIENQNHDAKLLFGIMNSQDKCSDYNIEKEILEGSKAGSLVNNTALAGSNKAGSDSILHDGARRHGKLPKQRIAYSAARSYHGNIGKSVLSKCNLQDHMSIHAKDNPYSCELCGRSFRRKDNLARHVRTHTEAKPYSCETCGKGFRRKENLGRHMRIHTGEKLYSCDVCGMEFGRRDSLNYHMLGHSSSRYGCDICNKSFKHSKILIRHVRDIHKK
ncbi:MAG: C2H2-type zinc finger protein [Candidatus Endonucleobacter bathymodioli]|uniref:C2H2-type zinc finger protein n=1 Tax=Candidatus Endonucleibacter bathymodioli TaxID=539814 RepID=A0AA90NUE9_9GAMM|nr:C2H2-type zinc finger protein [Candidatus Endonucleobacter bathymodioli]